MNNSLSADDKQLFHDAVARLQKTDLENSAVTEHIDLTNFYLSDYNIVKVGPNDILSFIPISLPQKLTQKFKRGTVTIDATLDLHGYTKETAKQKLLSFISDCLNNHHHTLLLIHGKGLSTTNSNITLKSAINCWLRQLPMVLAFHSAKQKHGGSGALYVILKSHKIKRG